MKYFDNETINVYGNSFINLCNDLNSMQKIGDNEGTDLCQSYVNTFVETITKNGHLGEIRNFVKNTYDEEYLHMMDKAYTYNQSKTLLSMCHDKDNPTSQNPATDVDILKFLINVEQAGEIDKPLENMGAFLKQQLEEVCPFEPDFNSEEEQEYYYLIVNHYCDAMPYIYTALNIQTAKEANQPVPSEFNE